MFNINIMQDSRKSMFNINIMQDSTKYTQIINIPRNNTQKTYKNYIEDYHPYMEEIIQKPKKGLKSYRPQSIGGINYF